MEPPSKADVIDHFQRLIREQLSREDVATWAEKWVAAEDPPDLDDDVWEALKFLASVDLISTDRPYLYSVEDFEHELRRLGVT